MARSTQKPVVARRLEDLGELKTDLVSKIPHILQPCTSSHVGQLEEVFKPGLTMITWCSLNVEKCKHSAKRLFITLPSILGRESSAAELLIYKVCCVHI